MSADRIYDLLPAIYRTRDALAGQPLRALLAVIQEEADRIERELEATYDNWFIETCDEWVVPYLADLLGVRGIQPIGPGSVSLRAYVANTLAFRQRKGTASVLEDLARAVTGWPAAAVEMFQRLAATQHLAHVVPARVRTPDLRDTDALELLGGPFEQAHRFADVRSIAQRRGRYNIPNVALYVWRLEAFAVEQVRPASVDAARFRFSRLGDDVRLFGSDRIDSSADRTDESEVPGPLRRRPIHDELEQARRALAAGEEPRRRFLPLAGEGEPVFRIFEIDAGGDATEITPDRIQVCDLSQWTTNVPAAASYVDPASSLTVTARVSVDPVLGRLLFLPVGAPPADVRVSYRHGFPGPLGGGLYERGDSLLPAGSRLHLRVGAGPDATHASLAAAVAAWAADPLHPDALIELLDSDEHAVADIAVPPAVHLELRAADGCRPLLRASAPWRLTLNDGSAIALDGLLVAGAPLEVAMDGGATERRLSLRHTTLCPGHGRTGDGAPLVPGAPSITLASSPAGRLLLSLDRCVTGPIDLSPAGPDGSVATLTDAIVDDAGGGGVVLRAGMLELDAVTVLGGTAAAQLEASNTIFDAPVTIDRTQHGCVRYSWLPEGSIAPRRHRCQPDLALEALPAAEAPSTIARLRPTYTSRRYGDAAYVQLGARCAVEILRGADDGDEMGAWHFLCGRRREDNLATVLDEYLRFGLEAGVFTVT